MGDALAPGDRVGQYTIDSALGIGSMGISYRAHNVAGDVVVLKFLRSVAPLTDREKLRIAHEIDALASLDNPLLPGNIEFVVFGGDYAIVTEYQRLGDLAGRLSRGPLPVATAVTLMRHIASAVGAAHSAGVVHGGITAANVLRRSLDGRQVPLLVDCGAALRSHAWIPPLDAPDVTRYRAPELQAGRHPTPATDVFALGALFGQMLGPTAPPELRDIVARAMDPRPRRRYRNGDDFRAALVIGSGPLGEPVPMPSVVFRSTPGRVEPRLPDDRQGAARLVTREAIAEVGPGYQPKGRLIGGVAAAALLVLVLSVLFAGPKGSVFGGATHKPPAPGVVATPSYRSVVFMLQQPGGDASVVEVLNGTTWNQVGSSTYTVPTAKGGQQVCATFRVADESQTPTVYGPQAQSCGTSAAPTLSTQLAQTGCRYAGRRQVCYTVLAAGLQPGATDTMVVRVDGKQVQSMSITVDKSGHATLPDGEYIHFTAASAGKTADVTYLGLEFAWTIDKLT